MSVVSVVLREKNTHTTGTGLMIINNITQIAEAIEGHKDDSIGSLFVIMIGTFNALGRLMGGGLSDFLIGRVARPTLLALALLGMAAGSLIFAFATYVVFEREAREYLFSYSLTERTHSCHLHNQ